MTVEILPHPDPDDLAARIAAVASDRSAKKGKYARDIARYIGISEGLMLSGRCGKDVTRLQPASKEMIDDFISLGEVMVLTRNESCVIEKVGEFGKITQGKFAVVVLNREIDLRIFLKRWVHVFAVEEKKRSSVKRSIQIFDAEGMAVNKIFMRETSDLDAFNAIITKYRHDNQAPFFQPWEEEKAQKEPTHEDASIDIDALRADWRQTSNVHQFVKVLRKHEVSRQQAFRLAGEDLAQALDPGAIAELLSACAEKGVPVMTFVSNHGCVQVHAGPIKETKRAGTWFNILDPRFNLHLREDHIHSVWMVRKYFDLGHSTTIEVFDRDDTLILQINGLRQGDQDEDPAWREISENLTKLDSN